MPHRGMEGSAEAFVAAGEALAHAEAGASFSRLRDAFARHALRSGERLAGVAVGWDPPYLGKGTASSTARCRSSTWRPRSSRPPSAPTHLLLAARDAAQGAQHAPRRDAARGHPRAQRGDAAHARARRRRGLRCSAARSATCPRASSRSPRLAASAWPRAAPRRMAERAASRMRSAPSRPTARAAPRGSSRTRVAWLSEQGIVDLGARTRGLQVQALFRRLGRPAAQLAAMRQQDVPRRRCSSCPCTPPTCKPASCKRLPTPSSSTAASQGRRSTSSASRSRCSAPVPRAVRARCTSAAPSARRPRCAPPCV